MSYIAYPSAIERALTKIKKAYSTIPLGGEQAAAKRIDDLLVQLLLEHSVLNGRDTETVSDYTSVLRNRLINSRDPVVAEVIKGLISKSRELKEEWGNGLVLRIQANIKPTIDTKSQAYKAEKLRRQAKERADSLVSEPKTSEKKQKEGKGGAKPAKDVSILADETGSKSTAPLPQREKPQKNNKNKEKTTLPLDYPKVAEGSGGATGKNQSPKVESKPKSNLPSGDSSEKTAVSKQKEQKPAQGQSQPASAPKPETKQADSKGKQKAGQQPQPKQGKGANQVTKGKKGPEEEELRPKRPKSSASINVVLDKQKDTIQYD